MIGTNQPLADRMRPKDLDDYVGQEHLVGEILTVQHASKVCQRVPGGLDSDPIGCRTEGLYEIRLPTLAHEYAIRLVTDGL